MQMSKSIKRHFGNKNYRKKNVTLSIPYMILYVSMQSGILWVKKGR